MKTLKYVWVGERSFNSVKTLKYVWVGERSFTWYWYGSLLQKGVGKYIFKGKSSVSNPFLFYLSIILKGGVFRNIVFSGENKGKSKHNFVWLLVKLFRLDTKKKMYWEIPSASWDNGAIKCVVNWKIDPFFSKPFYMYSIGEYGVFHWFLHFLSTFRSAFQPVIGKSFFNVPYLQTSKWRSNLPHFSLPNLAIFSVVRNVYFSTVKYSER